MNFDSVRLSRGAVDLLKQSIARGSRINIRALPETREGDEVFAFLEFQYCHGRLPTSAMLFSDFLFRMKVGEEILNPLRVFVTDKEFLKVFIKATVGDTYNVPTISVLRTPEELDGYNFPPTCCIKPTHASQKVIFRENGSPFDKEAVKSWFSINYYRFLREANYKTLTPKVIVEPLIFGKSLNYDFKFYCFEGRARLVHVDAPGKMSRRRAFYDLNWVKQRFSLAHPMIEGEIPRPDNLTEMLAVVEMLSSNFNFVRIDAYSNGRKFLIGEITNCPGSARRRFLPTEAETEASNMIFGSP